MSDYLYTCSCWVQPACVTIKELHLQHRLQIGQANTGRRYCQASLLSSTAEATAISDCSYQFEIGEVITHDAPLHDNREKSLPK